MDQASLKLYLHLLEYEVQKVKQQLQVFYTPKKKISDNGIPNAPKRVRKEEDKDTTDLTEPPEIRRYDLCDDCAEEVNLK